MFYPHPTTPNSLIHWFTVYLVMQDDLRMGSSVKVVIALCVKERITVRLTQRSLAAMVWVSTALRQETHFSQCSHLNTGIRLGGALLPYQGGHLPGGGGENMHQIIHNC